MTPPAEVVGAYLAAVQEARRRQGPDGPWQRVAALLAANAHWRFAGAGRHSAVARRVRRPGPDHGAPERHSGRNDTCRSACGLLGGAEHQ